MAKQSDPRLTFITIGRTLTYLVYFYVLTAVVFLSLGFILLLFGANTSVPFVDFVYKIAAEFLQPFRGIFPVHQISDRSYFSAAGLFAIVMYGLAGGLLHALIDYFTLKQTQYKKEMLETQQQINQLQQPVSRSQTVRR